MCWDCAKQTGGCSWSKNFEAVKGLKAIPTKLKVEHTRKRGDEIGSYDVYECPEFELRERLKREGKNND